MADEGFNAYDKYPGFNKEKTIMYNASEIVTASGFVAASDGTYTLANNKATKIMVVPITGLREGDILKNFRLLGAIGATPPTPTVLDADFRKVTKGTGVVTDASIASITQVSASVDAALDQEKSLSKEKVAADYQYYVKITGTSAADAGSDVAITGVEVDIERA